MEKIITAQPANKYDQEIRLWAMLAKVSIGAGILTIGMAYVLVSHEISFAIALIGTFAAGCGVGMLILIASLGRAR